MMWLHVLVGTSFILSVYSFGSSEERFVKKYAMMKIYESCFGAEVVKQIRKEMKAACMKCAMYEAPQPQSQPHHPMMPPRPLGNIPSKLDDGITDPENTIYANAQAFDVNKLNHAILTYRPNAIPMNPYRPYQAPGYYPGYPTQPSMYFPYQQPNPFGLAPYNVPYFGQQYYNGGQRTGRNLDIKNQLEILTSRMSGKVKNVTCVMQELGYLDDNLEPNYPKIRERISSLPVADELRKDMQEGVTFCQQFSQCIPEISTKSPLSRELSRLMFFFKCYKHKKLEACIMKDVREKYTDVADDDFEDEMELRRTGKATKIEKEDSEDLSHPMYDFLYGIDSNMDVDSLF